MEDDFFELREVPGLPDSKPEKKEIEKITDLVPLASADNLLVKTMQEVGISVPKEKLDIIEGFMARAHYGHQAVLPMNCKGEQCSFIGMCPLAQAKLELPIGKNCPVEKALLETWVNKTVFALNIDANDPEFSVDLDMVYELAGMELLRMRASHHLSKDPSLVEERVVGYSPQGQPIYDEKPKVSLLILEKYSKVVNKLREQLLATRKAQAQAGQMAGDISVRTANIMERARKLAQIRRAGGSVQDADFEIKEEKLDEREDEKRS
jgi:hypothetical protein